MPVKKAFVSFDLNSINVTGRDESNLKTIKTQPKKSGPNPTINTVIKFDIRLPEEDIFMPEMQCVVYDYILAGLVNQMLGIFILPLKEIIYENKKQIDRDMKITEKKLALYLLNKSAGTHNLLGENGNLLDVSDVNISMQSINEINKQGLMPSDNYNSNQYNKEFNFGTSPSKNNSGNNIGVNNKEKRGKYDLLQDDQVNDVALDIKNNTKVIPGGDNDPREIKIKDDMKTGMVVQENMQNYNKNEININSNNQINLPRNQNNQPKTQFIIKPVYKKYNLPGNKPGTKNFKDFEIEDESQMPDKDLYHPVGYNKYKQDDKKHYRRIYNCNLEDCTELNLCPPFYKIALKRGKFVDQTEDTGIFEALTDKDSKIIKRFRSKGGEDISGSKELDLAANKFFDDKHYGDFKGLIRIVEKDQMKRYEGLVESIRNKGNSNLLKDFKFLTNFEDISKRILVEKECVVRIYVLNLGDLAKKDTFSESDPFLKIYCGGQVVNESDNAQEDKANCSWCKFYE